MPKAKTHKSLAKRFKLTGTGKLMRKKQGRRHLLSGKSAQKKRRLAKSVPVGDSFLSKYRRLMLGE